MPGFILWKPVFGLPDTMLMYFNQIKLGPTDSEFSIKCSLFAARYYYQVLNAGKLAIIFHNIPELRAWLSLLLSMGIVEKEKRLNSRFLSVLHYILIWSGKKPCSRTTSIIQTQNYKIPWAWRKTFLWNVQSYRKGLSTNKMNKTTPAVKKLKRDKKYCFDAGSHHCHHLKEYMSCEPSY